MFNQELDENNQPIKQPASMIGADLFLPKPTPAPQPTLQNRGPFPTSVDMAGQSNIVAPLEDFNQLPSDMVGESNAVMADQQSGMDQVGNAFARGIMGEFVGGTLQTLGGLVDNGVYNALTGSESEFGKMLYELGKQIQDSTNESFPIYSEDRFDPGWWASGASSTMSVLSSLVPGLGVAKGMEALGKLAKMSSTARAMLAEGVGALAMRHGENYREAEMVKKNVFERGMQQGLGFEAANAQAAEAAAQNYQINMANYAFDLFQLSSVLKPMRVLTRNADGLAPRVADEVGKVVSPFEYYGKKVGKQIALQTSEGVEEMVNEISSIHSQRTDGADLSQTIRESMGNPNVWDSFMWGTAGGALMQGVGQLWNNEERLETQNKLDDISSRNKILQDFAATIKNNPGDEAKIQEAKNKLMYNYAISAVKSGNVDLALEQLNDPKALAAMGIENPDSQSVADLRNTLESVERSYQTYVAPFKNEKYNALMRETATGIEFEAGNQWKLATNYEKAIQQRYQDLGINTLTPVARQYLDNYYRTAAVTANNGFLTARMEQMDQRNPDYAELNQMLKQGNKELVALENQRQQIAQLLTTPQQYQIGNARTVETVGALDNALAPYFNDELATKHAQKQQALDEHKLLMAGLDRLQTKQGKELFEQYVDDTVEQQKAFEKEIKKRRKEQERKAKSDAKKQSSKEKVQAEKQAAEQVKQQAATPEATPESTGGEPKKTSEQLLRELIDLIDNKKPDEYNSPDFPDRDRREQIAATVNALLNALESEGIDITNVHAVAMWIENTVGIDTYARIWNTVQHFYNGYMGTDHRFSPEQALNPASPSDHATTEAEEVGDQTEIDEPGVYQGIPTSAINMANNKTAAQLYDDYEYDSIRAREDARIIPGAWAIAWLNLPYEDIKIDEVAGTPVYRRVTKAVDLIPGLKDPRMMLPGYYMPGTKLTLEEDKGFAEDGKTYAQMVQREIDENRPNHYKPIAVKHDGKIVGYLHDMAWLNPFNVVEKLPDGTENLEKQRSALMRTRNLVIDKGPQEVYIDFKGAGWFEHHDALDRTVQKTTADSFPDPELELVVSKNNQLYSDKDTLYKDEVVNPNPEHDGLVHAIVPLANGKKVAIMLNTVKVGLERASTLVAALDAFIKRGEDKASERAYTQIQQASKNNINIYTADGVRRMFEQFVYTFNLNEANTNIIRNEELKGLRKRYVSVRSNGVDFQETGERPYSVTVELYKNNPELYKRNLERLQKHLAEMYVKVELVRMGNKINNPFPLVTFEGGTWVGRMQSYKDFIKANTTTNLASTPVTMPDGSVQYAYAFQPVMTFTFTKPAGEDVEVTKDTPEQVVVQEEPEEDLPDYTFGDLDEDEFNGYFNSIVKDDVYKDITITPKNIKRYRFLHGQYGIKVHNDTEFYYQLTPDDQRRLDNYMRASDGKGKMPWFTENGFFIRVGKTPNQASLGYDQRNPKQLMMFIDTPTGVFRIPVTVLTKENKKAIKDKYRSEEDAYDAAKSAREKLKQERALLAERKVVAKVLAAFSTRDYLLKLKELLALHDVEIEYDKKLQLTQESLDKIQAKFENKPSKELIDLVNKFNDERRLKHSIEQFAATLASVQDLVSEEEFDQIVEMIERLPAEFLMHIQLQDSLDGYFGKDRASYYNFEPYMKKPVIGDQTISSTYMAIRQMPSYNAILTQFREENPELGITNDDLKALNQSMIDKELAGRSGKKPRFALGRMIQILVHAKATELFNKGGSKFKSIKEAQEHYDVQFYNANRSYHAALEKVFDERYPQLKLLQSLFQSFDLRDYVENNLESTIKIAFLHPQFAGKYGVVLAHEFGHALDFFLDGNNKKLKKAMYGFVKDMVDEFSRVDPMFGPKEEKDVTVNQSLANYMFNGLLARNYSPNDLNEIVPDIFGTLMIYDPNKSDTDLSILKPMLDFLQADENGFVTNLYNKWLKPFEAPTTPVKAVVPVTESAPVEEKVIEEPKKESIFERILRFFKDLFGIVDRSIKHGAVLDELITETVPPIVNAQEAEALEEHVEAFAKMMSFFKQVVLDKDNFKKVVGSTRAPQGIIKSKIIFGHPGIGKTFARNQNPNRVLDFDSDYKSRINEKYGLEEGFKARNEWRKENEELWRVEIRQLWEEAKRDAARSGKTLIASDMLLLREFAKDFDKVLTMSKETFVERAKQRDDYNEGTEGWKNSLDVAIGNIDPSKVMSTNKYLSDLLDDGTFNSPPEGTPEYTPKSYLVDATKFDGFKQNTVVKLLMSFVLGQLQINPKVSQQAIFAKLKQNFAKEKNPAFKDILDNFDAFQALAMDKLRQLDFIKVNEKFKDVIMANEDDANEAEERMDYVDERTLYMDPKESMSGRLRQFFTFIPSGEPSFLDDYEATGKIRFPIFKDFDEVINFLHTELVGIEPDFDKMIAHLETIKHKQPWIENVITKLRGSEDGKQKGASDRVRNEFVVSMRKQYAKHRIVLWRKQKDGTYSVNVVDSDRSSVAKALEEDWYDNLVRSTRLVIQKDGKLYISKAEVEALTNEYDSMSAAAINGNMQPLQDWLKRIGVEISIDALIEIYQRPFKYFNMPFKALFTTTGGVFNIMKARMNAGEVENDATENTLALNNPLVNNSGVYKLAQVDARFKPFVYSNSFRNADNNTVYAYSMPTYLSDRIEALKTDPVLHQQLLSSPFSKTSTWLQELKDPNTYMSRVFDVSYVDGLNRMGGGQKGTRLMDMSPREHEIYKMALHANSSVGEAKRKVGMYFMPTFSDKTRMAMVSTVRHNTGLFFNKFRISAFSGETEAQIRALLQAEINRMSALKVKPSKIAELNAGGNKFLFFPDLNKEESLFIDGWFDTSKTEEAYKLAEQYVISLIEQKKTVWRQLGLLDTNRVENPSPVPHFLDKRYLEDTVYKNVTEESQIATYAAADYVINNMIALGNMFQLVVGDPALYWKKDMAGTYDNIGKRLAAMIAPGHSLADSFKENFNYIFLSDQKSVSRNINEIRAQLEPLGLDAKAYTEIEGTDAQELTTLAEHLKVMNKLGRVSTKQMETLLARAKEESLSTEELKLILQPMKPVYTNMLWDGEEKVHRVLYVKTSSFPLIPQLTKGLEMDKVRQAMEDQEIDRLSYKTGVKVGGFDFINIWTDDNRIIPVEDLKKEFGRAKHTVSRKGWRLQQEVPYDEDKKSVTKGSQETKLLFLDILDVQGFEYNGTKYSGEELKNEYENLHKHLYQLKHDKLMKELKNENNELDITKLRDMMKREAEGRGMSKYDIDSLDTFLTAHGKEAFVIPVWAHPMADKFESLLISLVNKTVIKQKMPGKSFVLGSESGMQEVEGDVSNVRPGIVWVPGYDPTKGLMPQTTKGPAQVIAPFRFRSLSGELLNVRDFMDKDGRLDVSRVPEELLQLFGFRIPTQGHNSMSWIQIVGFLPEESGDLIIAPKDFTKQMGSDFDVDKLYTYMYHTRAEYDTAALEALYTTIANDMEHTDAPLRGELKRLNKEFEEATDLDEKAAIERKRQDIAELVDKYKGHPQAIKARVKTFVRDSSSDEKMLQNQIIDIHFAVLKHPEVWPNIISALGFGELPRLADTVTDIRASRKSGEISASILSEQYFKEKYINGTVGKSMTGIKSLDSTLNATIQGKGMYFGKRDGSEIVIDPIYFDKEARFDLSGKKSLDGKNKSYHIAAYQSAAVDNEKEQLLGKINCNKYTAAAERAILQVGYPADYAVMLMSQDVILEFVEEMKRLGDSTTEGSNRNAFMNTYELLKNRYMAREYGDSQPEYTIDHTAPISLKEMEEKLQGPSTINYNIFQLNMLEKFKHASDLGEALGDLQRAINTDSAGLGKNFLETLEKEDDVTKHVRINRAVQGSVRAIGKVTHVEDGEPLYEPTTINGFAIEQGLKPANRLFTSVFPTNTPVMESIFKELEIILGYEQRGSKMHADTKKLVWDSFKSYLFATGSLWREEIIAAYRYELLYDEYAVGLDGTRIQTKESLAAEVKKLARSEKGRNNAFLQKLDFSKISETGQEPSLITYTASKGENFDEDDTYQGFIDLLTDPETMLLARDMVAYAYLTGGIQKAINFVKYVPPSLLVESGLAEFLRNVDFDSPARYNIVSHPSNEFDVSPFTQQFIQHNPQLAIRMPYQDFIGFVDEVLTKDSAGNPIEFTVPAIPPTEQRAGFKFGNLIQIRKIGGRAIETYPNFIAVPIGMGSGNRSFGNTSYALYKMVKNQDTYQANTYVQISTLGGPYNFTEYDPNVLFRDSIVEANQVTLGDDLMLGKYNENMKKVVAVPPRPQTGHYFDKYSVFHLPTYNETGQQYSVDRIIELMEEVIANAASPEIKVLAEFQLSAMKELNMDLRLRIRNNDALGSYMSSMNLPEDSNVMALNKVGLKGCREVDFQNIVLHEMGHVLTVDTLARIEAHPTNENGVTIPESQRAAYKTLDRLLNDVENKIRRGEYEKYGLTKAGLDRFRALYAKYELDKTSLSKEEHIEMQKLRVYYAFQNLREFSTMSLNDPELRAIFNQIPYASDNLLNTLLKWIKELLASFGFVPDKTLLKAAMEPVVALIGHDPNTYEVKGKPSDPTSPSLPPVMYTNHSGGATGADSAWEDIGKEFGVVNHKHYYHGKKTPRGNVEITEGEYAEGVARVMQANKRLNRRPEAYMDLLARNWMQVKNSDAIYAIGELASAYEVKGGTGWAVQMAIDAGKDIYVYDQKLKEWAFWDGKEFKPFKGTPVLVKNFAGIGSRELNDAGRQAIRDVYKATFPAVVSTPKASSSKEFTWARYAPNGYEVSSSGDKRFSALYARLADGRTIEEAYQLDIKGYRVQGNDPMLGKGKPPLIELDPFDQWEQYKALWKQYLDENPGLLEDLRKKVRATPSKTLTDKYAATEISQARALAEILNETPESATAIKTHRMPMMFKDGDGGRKMRPEFRGKSTMDLIKSGDRTATSRAPDKMPVVNIGDIIIFFDKNEEVKVRVTQVPYFVDSISAEQWSKLEGWDVSEYERIKDKYLQITYELIDKPKQSQDNTYTGIITPDMINGKNAVYVFGSNPLGINGNPATGTGGAALVANKNGWVKQGEKMDNKLSESGKAWGIVTVKGPGQVKSLKPEEIMANIAKLYNYAMTHLDTKFYVAYKAGGRNLNGYTSEELAAMFDDAGGRGIPRNIIFEDKFQELIYAHAYERELRDSKESKEPEPIIPSTNEFWNNLPKGPNGRFDLGGFEANEEQHEALVEMFKWIYDPEGDKMMTLSGYAGTGKTTLMNFLLKHALVRGKDLFGDKKAAVIVSAPTHKAKNNIAKISKLPGITIHKLLGIKPHVMAENFTADSVVFDRRGKNNDFADKIDLIVMDEASMINSELYKHASNSITNRRARILFLGDPAQLASPSDDGKPSKVFTANRALQLTKIERTASTNPLIPIFTAIRNNLKAINPIGRRQTMMDMRGKGIHYLKNYFGLWDYVKTLYTNPLYTHENDLNFVKALAFTNATVGRLNAQIRLELFGTEKASKETWIVGEPIMSYYTMKTDDPAEEPFFTNSSDYKIVEVDHNKEDGYYNLLLLNPDTNEQDSVKVLDMSNPKAVEAYKTQFLALSQNLEDLKAANASPKIIALANEALDDFKSDILVPETLQIPGFKTRWGERPVRADKQIDYGYAITIHKSQGSTYKNVIIIEDDINSAGKREGRDIVEGEATNMERNRLRYVAYSRASDRAIVIHREAIEENGYQEPKVDEFLGGLSQSMPEVDLRFINLINELTKRKGILYDRLSKAKLKDDKAQIARVQRDIESLLGEIEVIREDKFIEKINEFGLKELREVRVRLTYGATEDELNYLLYVISLWRKATSILEEDIAMLDEESANMQQLKSIQAQADMLYQQWTKIAQSRVVKMINETRGLNVTVQDVFSPSSDIDILTAWFRDGSTTGDTLLQSIDLIMREASAKTNDEYREFSKDLEARASAFEETNEYKKNRYENFLQTRKDKKTGEILKTGNLVSYMDFDFLMRYHDLKRRARGSKYRRDYDNLRIFKQMNMFVMDPRVFAYDLYKKLGGTVELTKEERDTYEERLRNIMGDRLFEEKRERVLDKLDEFQSRRQAEKEMYELEGDSKELVEKKLKEWDKWNSPFDYLVWRSANDAFRNQTWSETAMPNDEFVEEIPKRWNDDKTSTGFWDPKYEAIMDNPEMEAMYDYLYKAFQKYMNYLPENVRTSSTNRVFENTIPEVSKTLLEEYNERGVRGWLGGVHDKLIESIVQSVGSDLSGAVIAPTSGKERPNFVLRMIPKADKLAGLGPEEKSYNLPLVLDLFARQSIMFKHKVGVQDMIYLTNDILQDIKEIKLTPMGQPVRHFSTKEILLREGLDNKKKMLDYMIKAFHGQKREVEGATTKKIKTNKDKRQEKRIYKAIEENEQRYKDQKIPKDQYEKRLEELEGKLRNLGDNLVWSRVGDVVIQYMQLKGLGWNVMSGVSNVTFGLLSSLIHAAGGEDFDTKTYMQSMQLVMATAFSPWARNRVERLKVGNKIANLMEVFDVLKAINDTEYDSFVQNNRAMKGLKKLSPYEFQRRGEYLAQGSMFVAMLKSQPIEGHPGKTWWDAFNESGEWDTATYGPAPDFHKFKFRMDQVLKRSHGNYDPNSYVQLKRWIIGRMLLQFRSWIAEGFANRFESQKHDALLGRDVKGRWRTYGSLGFKRSALTVSKQLANTLTLGKIDRLSKGLFEGLNDLDTVNMKKNYMELRQVAIIYLAIQALLAALEGADEDEEKRKLRLAINYFKRVNNDFFFYGDPESFESITQNPLPVFKAYNDTRDWLSAVGNYVVYGEEADIIPTGIHADESRAWRTTKAMVPGAAALQKLDNAQKTVFGGTK